VTRLERKNDGLERKLESAREENEELAEKLERLKALWRLDHSNFADVADQRAGLVPVKPLAQFTKAAIEDAQERFGLARDDVVYLRDASGAGKETAELLAEVEPRVVLRDGNLSQQADEVLFGHEIPVGPADDVTIQEVDELAVAREGEVETVIEHWEARAEVRRKDRTDEMVDRLISEHRAESKRAERGESD